VFRHHRTYRLLRLVAVVAIGAASVSLSYGAHAASSTLFDNTLGLTSDADSAGMASVVSSPAAQSFTTGDSPSTLTSAAIRVRDSNQSNGFAAPSSVTISLWSSQGGLPGTALATLASSLSVQSWSDTYLVATPTSPVSLSARTTYFIVVQADAGGTLAWKMNTRTPSTSVSPSPTFSSYVSGSSSSSYRPGAVRPHPSGTSWSAAPGLFLLQVIANVPVAPTLTPLANQTQQLTHCSLALPLTNSSPAGTWSYASSDTSVATVTNGIVHCVREGVATVTATFNPSDSASFLPATSTFTMTVTPAPVVTTTTSSTTTTVAVTTTTLPPVTTTTAASHTTTTLARTTTTAVNIFGSSDAPTLTAHFSGGGRRGPLVISARGSSLDVASRVVTSLDARQCSADTVTDTGSYLGTCIDRSVLSAGTHIVSVTGRMNGRSVTLVGALSLTASGAIAAAIQPAVVTNFTGPQDPRLRQALRLHRPIYDPAAHPHGTAGVIVAAGALMALAGAGGLTNSAREAAARRQNKKVAKVASATTKKLKSATREHTVWGDRSVTWRSPWTGSLDSLGQRIPQVVGPYSAVATRVVADGAWLRAITGGWYVVAMLAAVATAVFTYVHHVGVIYLPTTSVLFIIIALGIVDALIAAAAWLALVIAAVVTGAVSTGADIRTLLGMGALTCTISLLGHAIRPLRRLATDASEKLERAIDYVVMPVFVAFAGSAMATALNGLSGVELFTPAHVVALRWLIVGLILVRLVGEDVAIAGYPERSKVAQPAVLPAPKTIVSWGSLLFKFSVYLLVMYPYFGVTAQTVTMAFIANVPGALKIIEPRLPNYPLIHRWLPRGLTNFLVTLVIGAVSARALLGVHPSADHAKSMLIPLLLPGLLLGILSELGREGTDWTNATVRRSLGVVVWATALAIVTGYLVITW